MRAISDASAVTQGQLTSRNAVQIASGRIMDAIPLCSLVNSEEIDPRLLKVVAQLDGQSLEPHGKGIIITTALATGGA